MNLLMQLFKAGAAVHCLGRAWHLSMSRPCVMPPPTPLCHSHTHAPPNLLTDTYTHHTPSCSVFYPRVVVHTLFASCAHTYTTAGAITRGTEVHTAYQLPSSPPVPIDVQFLETAPDEVPVSVLDEGGCVCVCVGGGGEAVEACVVWRCGVRARPSRR
jgi:hypothetical protein